MRKLAEGMGAKSSRQTSEQAKVFITGGSSLLIPANLDF